MQDTGEKTEFGLSCGGVDPETRLNRLMAMRQTDEQEIELESVRDRVRELKWQLDKQELSDELYQAKMVELAKARDKARRLRSKIALQRVDLLYELELKACVAMLQEPLVEKANGAAKGSSTTQLRTPGI